VASERQEYCQTPEMGYLFVKTTVLIWDVGKTLDLPVPYISV
jgi:hypothetical protein